MLKQDVVIILRTAVQSDTKKEYVLKIAYTVRGPLQIIRIIYHGSCLSVSYISLIALNGKKIWLMIDILYHLN